MRLTSALLFVTGVGAADVAVVAGEPRPQGPVTTAQRFTNEDVARRTKQGAPEDALIEEIQEPSAWFDVSYEALTALRLGGVSKRVIAAMLARGAGNPATAPPRPATTTAATIRKPAIARAAIAETPNTASTTKPAFATSAPTAEASETPKVFELRAFRATRRLLISRNRIEYELKNSQGQLQRESFATTCEDVVEQKPSRFSASIELELKSRGKYAFEVSGEDRAALLAALANACSR